MPFKGDIKDFALTEIVQLIGMSAKTGKLVIEYGTRGCNIYFKNGYATYAHPLYQKDKIGELLVKNGVLKKADIEAALSLQSRLKPRNKLRIGTILVEMGIISRKELIFHLETQIKDCIYEVLSENRGQYEFINEFDLDEKDIIADLNIENMILESMLSVDEWKLVKVTLGDFNNVYTISVDPEYDFGQFTVDEWKVITLVDGKRTVNQIVGVSKLDNLSVCKTLSSLLEASIIRRLNKVDKEETKPVKTLKKPKNGFIRMLIERISSI